jgi:hypothetical protein
VWGLRISCQPGWQVDRDYPTLNINSTVFTQRTSISIFFCMRCNCKLFLLLCICLFLPSKCCHCRKKGFWVSEFQKVGILGSRIPDIFLEKSGNFWLRPEIWSICWILEWTLLINSMTIYYKWKSIGFQIAFINNYCLISLFLNEMSDICMPNLWSRTFSVFLELCSEIQWWNP